MCFCNRAKEGRSTTPPCKHAAALARLPLCQWNIYHPQHLPSQKVLAGKSRGIWKKIQASPNLSISEAKRALSKQLISQDSSGLALSSKKTEKDRWSWTEDEVSDSRSAHPALRQSPNIWLHHALKLTITNVCNSKKSKARTPKFVWISIACKTYPGTHWLIFFSFCSWKDEVYSSCLLQHWLTKPVTIKYWPLQMTGP